MIHNIVIVTHCYKYTVHGLW